MKVNTFYKQKRKKQKSEKKKAEHGISKGFKEIQRSCPLWTRSLQRRWNEAEQDMKGIGEGRGKNQEKGMGAEQLELVEYRLGQWEKQGRKSKVGEDSTMVRTKIKTAELRGQKGWQQETRSYLDGRK